jgi:hypothetical protein
MPIDIKQYQSPGPGKFEGEPPETAYFYDQWANGDGEDHCPTATDNETGTMYTVFKVDAEESEAFDLPVGAYVVLWEDPQGFVMTHVINESHAKAIAWINQHAGA